MILKFEFFQRGLTASPAMRLRLFLLPLFLGSCGEKDASVTVEEQRPRTLFDERSAGNILDQPPLSWRAIPGDQFRLKNYVAGPEEQVQVFLGQTQGKVLENANRWLGQFGQKPETSLEFFGRLKVLGVQSYLVEAEGDFGGGMGGDAQKDQALVGVIRPQKDGIISIKMTGPVDAVAQVRDEFLAYCRSLEVYAPQYLEKRPAEENESK